MRGGNGIDRFGIPPTAKVEIKIDQNRAKDRDYLDRARTLRGSHMRG